MFRRLAFCSVLVALGAGAAVIASAAFIAPHQATGTINTAVSGSDELHICQPSGTITTPQCPIDTDGADEIIFAATENLLAGESAWQKIRITNTGTEPWDFAGVDRGWTEVADPGGDCGTIPEAVRWDGTAPQGTGWSIWITVLGTSPSASNPGGYLKEPTEDIWYNASGANDNDEEGRNGAATFYSLDNVPATVHVEPGGYEDLLLGFRMPIAAPVACLGNVWELSTTWQVQPHFP